MLEIDELAVVVPGAASAGVESLAANNNLDLVRHDARWHLAWRTAPSHFASADARLELASAPELVGPWHHDATIMLGRDVREPRLVSDGVQLHLFFLGLGRDPKRFQPGGVWRSRFTADGWASPTQAIDADVVPWRIRRLGDRWAMIGYRGAERMYGPRPADPVVELRWSDDLERWSTPIDLHLGGTECELVELADGRVVGVTRNEGPGRRGSDLLVANDLDHLCAGGASVTPLARKLDSPNLICWEGSPWLFARRQVAHRGRYALAPPWLGSALAMRVDQAVWSLTRKRSSLFRIEVGDRRLHLEADLRSGGDTAFAAAVIDDDGSLVVADYRTPPATGDVAWLRGQLGATEIALHRVRRR
jgi:hypothetical protein